MPKLAKFSKPEWQENPILAQIREAQSEVQHISAALKMMEKQALGGPLTGKAAFRRAISHLIASSRFEGWLISLNESFVGINYMTRTETVVPISDKTRTFYLAGEIIRADQEWSMVMATAAAARKAKNAVGATRSLLGSLFD